MPPPATTMANDGPRLAPATSDTTEIVTSFGASWGSTRAAFAMAMAPGTLSGTVHRLAHPGDQHRSTRSKHDPPPLTGPWIRHGIAEQEINGPRRDERKHQREDAAIDTQVNRCQQLPAVPRLSKRQHPANLPGIFGAAMVTKMLAMTKIGDSNLLATQPICWLHRSPTAPPAREAST